MVIMEEYSDIHRATLQTLMNHGCLNEEKFKTIFECICTKLTQNDQTRRELTDVVDQVNEKICQFDQKIVKYQYGLDYTNYYIFCSTAKTSVSKMQHCFTDHDLEFFKSIFTQVATNEDLCISPREALNLQTAVGGKLLTKVRAEKLIDNWCVTGYFVRLANLIYLGPKSLAEFKEDLQTMQVDHLKVCALCDDLAAWGITCGSCKTAKYHKNCIEKFLARSDKCPSCKEKWTVSLEG